MCGRSQFGTKSADGEGLPVISSLLRSPLTCQCVGRGITDWSLTYCLRGSLLQNRERPMTTQRDVRDDKENSAALTFGGFQRLPRLGVQIRPKAMAGNTSRGLDSEHSFSGDHSASEPARNGALPAQAEKASQGALPSDSFASFQNRLF